MNESQNSKDLSDERLRKLANRNDVIAAMAKEILGLRHTVNNLMGVLDNLNGYMNDAVKLIDDTDLYRQRSASSKATTELIQKIKRDFAL